MNKIKNLIILMVAVMMIAGMTACKSNVSNNAADNNTTAAVADNKETDKATESSITGELTVLAAASLTDVTAELKAEFEKEYEGITLTFSYGSSGALQTQIEEGAPCDVFMSAATKQMNALSESGKVDTDSVVKLLENKVVLIVPKDSTLELTSFADVAGKDVEMIALGEPGSVPVGQYSQEIFTSLNILDEVVAKANYASDVRGVLAWVEEGEVSCGVVYATDAAVSDKVKVVCEAEDGLCAKVIYPVGIVSSSTQKDAAGLWIEFLQSEKAMEIFGKYGFSAAE